MLPSRASSFLRKRPLISLSTLSAAGAFVYASALEARADHRVATSTGGSLPRAFDVQALEDYWAQRPISTGIRLTQIVYELGPVAAESLIEYVRHHHSTGVDIQKRAELAHHVHRNLAIRLREALTNLGPAFVKAGQQLSIRPDLVPPVVLQELQLLCDSVRPVEDAIALEILRDELRVENLDEIFAPGSLKRVASASLGQVYQGKLRSTSNHGSAEGELVAVKIQRPNTRPTFSLDLVLLQRLGRWLDAATMMVKNQPDFHQNLFESFARGSYAELDYEREAENQMRFQEELAVRRNIPVVVPNVYTEYTTERVLVTQWVEGIKLADCPPQQIRRLIPVGVDLFLTQMLDIGAFHADPHPGNLLVTIVDGQPRLCLIDFGLCVEILPQERKALTRAMAHLLVRDFDTLVAEDCKDLGFLPLDFDTTELKPIMTKILTVGLVDGGSSNLHQRQRKLMEISNELNEIFFTYPFSVPPFFALVTRGLGLLEGIALTGDPNFDIFRASAPFARRHAVQVFGGTFSRRNTLAK